MTWRNRFKLFFGIIAIFAVVAAATVVFSQRQGEIQSASAAVMADSYPVGTDYAGTMIEQIVDEGSVVAAGDPIAIIQSNSLLQDLDRGATIPSNEVYDVSSSGELTIKSSVDGVVSSLEVRQGGYVAAGVPVATIDATNSLFVEAEFELDPVDFARVEQDARVSIEMPDLGLVEGTVRSIEVETEDGVAITTVIVDAEQLVYSGPEGLIAPGTPVTATLHLRNENALSRVISDIADVVRDGIAAVREAIS